MEKTQICRICLTTDLTLHDMFKNGLNFAYDKILCDQKSCIELPYGICNYCKAQLIRCEKFRKQCIASNNYINNALEQCKNGTILSRLESYKSFPYTLETNTNIIELVFIESTIKQEIDIRDDLLTYLQPEGENLSDEEPLSTLSNKHKKEILRTKLDDYTSNNEVVKTVNGFDDNDFDEVDKEPNSTVDELDWSSQVKVDLLTKIDITDELLTYLKPERTNLSDEKPLSNKHKKEISTTKLKDYTSNNDVLETVNGFDEVDKEPDNRIDELDLSSQVEIVLLTKKEQIAEIQLRKNTENYINSFYKCDKCFKGFISDSTFQNHIAKHDPSNGSHRCDVCDTRWPNARALRGHQITSHERKFICKLCKHVSRSSYKAREHSKWHLGKVFICKICGATFRKSTSRLTHIRLHHPSEHVCDVCGDSFIGDHGLRMHKKRAHRQEVNATFCCSLCSFQFKSNDALKRHNEYDNCRTQVKPCLQCGENFLNEKSLIDHLKNTHNKNKVKCLECDRTFAHERSYGFHYQRAHLGVKLKSRSSRENRLGLVCEICGFACTTKSVLVCHQRKHTGEKPFQCKECPKRFSIMQRLQLHIRTHTGERPFKCSQCPKAFKHKAALNRHNRVHTGVKPYSCTYCSKSFSQSNSMKVHVRSVHLDLQRTRAKQ